MKDRFIRFSIVALCVIQGTSSWQGSPSGAGRPNDRFLTETIIARPAVAFSRFLEARQHKTILQYLSKAIGWNAKGMGGWVPELAEGPDLFQEDTEEENAQAPTGILFRRSDGEPGKPIPPDKSAELRQVVAAALGMEAGSIKIPRSVDLNRAWERRFNLESKIYREIFEYLWRKKGPQWALDDLAKGLVLETVIQKGSKETHGWILLERPEKSDPFHILLSEIPPNLWGMPIYKNSNKAGQRVFVELFYSPIPGVDCWLPYDVHYENAATHPTHRKFKMSLQGRLLGPGYRLTRDKMKDTRKEEKGDYLIVSRVPASGVISFGSDGPHENAVADAYNFLPYNGRPFAAVVGDQEIIHRFRFAGLKDPIVMQIGFKRNRARITKLIESHQNFPDVEAVFQKNGPVWFDHVKITNGPDGAKYFRAGSHSLPRYPKGKKPIPIPNIVAMPKGYTGPDELEVLIGESGVPAAYWIPGEPRGQFLRQLQLRFLEKGKKEEELFQVVSAFQRGLTEVRLKQAFQVAKEFDCYAVITRVPIEFENGGNTASVPAGGRRIIQIPAEVGKELPRGHLYGEIVYSSPKVGWARPIALRVGTYPSNDPLNYEKDQFNELVELEVVQTGKFGYFKAQWRDPKTPGGLKRLIQQLRRWIPNWPRSFIYNAVSPMIHSHRLIAQSV